MLFYLCGENVSSRLFCYLATLLIILLFLDAMSALDWSGVLFSRGCVGFTITFGCFTVPFFLQLQPILFCFILLYSFLFLKPDTLSKVERNMAFLMSPLKSSIRDMMFVCSLSPSYSFSIYSIDSITRLHSSPISSVI